MGGYRFFWNRKTEPVTPYTFATWKISCDPLSCMYNIIQKREICLEFYKEYIGIVRELEITDSCSWRFLGKESCKCSLEFHVYQSLACWISLSVKSWNWFPVFFLTNKLPINMEFFFFNSIFFLFSAFFVMDRFLSCSYRKIKLRSLPSFRRFCPRARYSSDAQPKVVPHARLAAKCVDCIAHLIYSSNQNQTFILPLRQFARSVGWKKRTKRSWEGRGGDTQRTPLHYAFFSLSLLPWAHGTKRRSSSSSRCLPFYWARLRCLERHVCSSSAPAWCKSQAPLLPPALQRGAASQDFMMMVGVGSMQWQCTVVY